MSIGNLKEADHLLCAEFSPEDYLFNGPCMPSAIHNAQDVLGVKFPKSYQYFLSTRGSGGPGGVYIYGLGNNDSSFDSSIPTVTAYHVVWSNIYERKFGLHPPHLISIYDVGEGTTYCLDTSQMNDQGECPVVAWPVGGYEETPILEIIAEDFGKFFLDKVREQIEYKNEHE